MLDNLTKFLLDFFLVKNLTKTVQSWTKQVQDRLSKIKPFSWETALLLSLFSWFVYLLLQSELARDFISIFAWGFLMIGVDWALLGKKVTIPIIGFQLQYGPWLTGAIASIAFLSNDFLITDVRSALISWPIFSAAFAAYPRFIQLGLKLKMPDPAARQDLVLLFLIAGLISCWFQFYFVVQDLLRIYPNLLADNFDRSAFVVRLNRERPTSRGYSLLQTAEQTVRQELTGKTWIEVQRWLRNTDGIEAELSRRIVTTAYDGQLPREQELWQITLETTVNAANPSVLNLALRTRWLGASSQPNGYTLRRDCTVQEEVLPPPQSFDELRTRQQLGNSFRMTCQQSYQERSE